MLMTAMKTGVYRITNTMNGRFYVGSSSNLVRRKRDHFNLLRQNRHSNPHLQSAWNKYGESAFVFEVLLECPLEQMIIVEQWLLNTYVNVELCYNIAKYTDNPTRGRRLTESHKTKLRQKRSYESRAKIQISKIGNTNSRRKLTPTQVLEIRRQYVPYKVSTIALGKKYGVSPTMISLIVNHQNWIGV
jgi:group I intron endonuclease